MRLLSSFLALAACASEPPEQAASPNVSEAAEPAPAPEAASADGQPLPRGDGSPIVLTVLSEAEIEEADVSVELVCAFANEEGVLLVAGGIVGGDEPARGLIKVGDHVQPVFARGAGFDAMRRRGEFVSQGLTLDVEPEGGDLSADEDSLYRARLRLQRADGAERAIVGEWRCGP